MPNTIVQKESNLLLERSLADAPAWLEERRRAAWNAFTALPLPSSSTDEDWRRTDISKIHLDDALATHEIHSPDASLLDALRTRQRAAAPEAAFAATSPGMAPQFDGVEQLREQGVIVCSLRDATLQHPALVQSALAHVVADESKFLALWNALWNNGYFIYVPDSVTACIPLWLAHTVAIGDATTFPATCVVLGKHASLTLIEDMASPMNTDHVVSTAATVLVLGDGARLDYNIIQEWSDSTWHISTHRATLARDAQLHFFGATLGAGVQKAYWEAFLEGTGADATLTGVAFGDAAQHLDHQSLQAHHAPSTRSDLLLKVAVRDTAHSVYSGLIDVAENAQKTNGYVQNRNLILTKGASAGSVPRLEIKANDVKCGHGAATGRIDEEQRFYLESRGVPREEAERLIISGFFDDVLTRIAHEGVRRFVGTLLSEEIEGRSHAGLALSSRS